jgi:hypothetical protein
MNEELVQQEDFPPVSSNEFDATEQEDASALRWLIDTEYFDAND